MNLKDKVLMMRSEFKRSHIFQINNPAIKDREYFGIFLDKSGELNYDFSNSEIEIYRLKAQRIKNRIAKKYAVLNKSEFVKIYFDYEFWLFCFNFADSSVEKQHFGHKIETIKNELFLL